MNIQLIGLGLLSTFFLFASSIKIFGWLKPIFEPQLAMFIKYGLNRQIMTLTGLIELFGSITIWFQGSWVGVFGALALLGTSVGALACHLYFDTWKDGVPAMITGLLSAYIIWTNHSFLLTSLG
ncbi:DoxX family protein [Neptunomonas japonica]|uniref:DoxX family protein n=1 Tax=Neptunomonas japonica JAMM 1380 TaxID=1441457 RepID=A0A7R6PL41_9GAMM|nr:DoxX family protein [Neptunomonas japonica]BBB31116.1 conserved hypothetical protein [Neptunomonas japonica JAMM 1380]